MCTETQVSDAVAALLSVPAPDPPKVKVVPAGIPGFEALLGDEASGRL
jgi:hypothetical protein